MLVVKGKHRGRTVTPHQFANDWVTVREIPGYVFNPTMLRVMTPADRAFFEHADRARAGTFWSEWVLNDDGTFSSTVARAARRPARRHYLASVRRERRRLR